MKNGIERRRYPRAPLHLPFTYVTAQGHIEAKTRDISVSGFSTILPFETFEVSKIEDEFQIVLNTSEDYEMFLDCKKIWSDNITLHNVALIGIGATFTKISKKDRNIIASLVEKFYLV